MKSYQFLSAVPLLNTRHDYIDDIGTVKKEENEG